MKHKTSFIAIAVFAMLIGTMLNLAINSEPAPKQVNAASTPTPKPTATPTPTPRPTSTPTPSYTISGSIFIDVNNNGKHNNDDSNYTPGATVSAKLNDLVITTIQSTNTGKFSFTGLQNGNYNILLTVPDKYNVTTNNPVTVIINSANETGVKFGIFPSNWMVQTEQKTVFCSDIRQFVKDHCGD